MRKTAFQTGLLIENRYRVLKLVSLDKMGALYRVSDEAQLDETRKKEIVALKTVTLDVPVEEKAEHVRQFQREFKILTQLRHPNLVDVYDYGVTTEGELYFTMEWVEGQDLDALLCQLKPTAVTSAMVQVCRALAYLHARGVIHGDLKPSNVLLVGDAGESSRQVKLVDFGVALETRTRKVQARYHTPGYTAPEIKEQRLADHRADLYGLGATWYAALVGEPPVFMPGPGKEPLIQLTLEQALGAESRFPAEIGPVIARLMARSPADRYSSANEVIEAVNEITGSAHQLETQETASSYALRARFVDRAAEIETLQTLWKQAQVDEGALVLVSGEGGVGKTRLVEEFVVQAELEGAYVARGQCMEGSYIAYRPWREALRVLTRYVEGTDQARRKMRQVGPVLATVLPELWERDCMQGLARPVDLEPSAARLRLNDAMVRMLGAAAELRPTVIVIEDAQWADEASLELLRFLARSCGQMRLLICVTHRDDEGGPAQSLAELAGDRVERIPLRRLPPEDATDLVRSMLGLEQLPASLTERVQRATEGNAFFVQELIRSLAEDGVVLQRTVEGWKVDQVALQDVRLPESIRQVAWQRLAHLSAETREVLCWAAVVGPMFWDGVLEQAGQVSRERVQAALSEGLERELIFERDTSAFEGEREFLFAKPAVQEVGRESVSPEERREVHERVAAWLMARSDEEMSEHLGLIADHLERAGQTEQAVVYLKRAGEQAAEQFASAEAIAYFSRALDLTPEDGLVGGRERYDLLLAREKMYHLQGAREVQAQDLAKLQELAKALDDDAHLDADGQQRATGRRIEVALQQADYGEATSDFPATIAAAQTAIHLAQAAGDMHSEAQGYLKWGIALWRQGEYNQARIQLERALSLARTAGLRGVEAGSLDNLGVVSNIQGDIAGSKVCFEQALSIYREIGDRQHEAWSLNNLGIVYGDQNDHASARSCWERALHIAREIGDRRQEGTVLGNLGNAASVQGDYAEARAYYEQARNIRCEVGDRQGEGIALGNIGLTFQSQGDYVQARTCLEQALHITREIGDQRLECGWLGGLGVLAHQQGDDQAALEYGRQALSIAREVDSVRFQAEALICLGRAQESLGRLEEAADTFRQVLDIRRELGQPHLVVEILAALASVSLAQENLDQAQTWIEKVLDYVETNDTLEGVEDPFQVYLTCYRVLRAGLDPRTEFILHAAYRLLQEQAAKIDDEESRRIFLENVPAHREIMEAWERG